MSDHLRDDVRAALAMSDAELAEAQQAQQLAEASTSLDADTLAALAISETDVWHHTVDVADANSLQELATDYKSGARADLYMAKLNDLRRLYERMHRVRGDGNCFYRALWVGWMQRLLSLPDARAREAVWRTRVPDVRRVPQGRAGVAARRVRRAAAPARDARAARGRRRHRRRARPRRRVTRRRRRGRRVAVPRDVGGHASGASSAPHIEGRRSTISATPRWRRWVSRPTSRRSRAWRARLAVRPRRASHRHRSWSARQAAPTRLRRAADGGGARAKSWPLRRASSSVPATTMPPTDWNKGARRRRRRQPRLSRWCWRSSTPPLSPACAEQRPVACESRRRRSAPGCARRGRAWTTPPPASATTATCRATARRLARGGRAYACARCVAASAPTTPPMVRRRRRRRARSLWRCPRLRAARVLRTDVPPPRGPRCRPSRRRPCAASGRRGSAARRPPPAGLPGDGERAIEGLLSPTRATPSPAPAATCRAPPSCCPPRGTGGVDAAAAPPPPIVCQERDGQVEMLVREYKVTAAAAEAAIDAGAHCRAFFELGQVAGIEEAVELLFQPSELRKWRPTNDFSATSAAAA